MSIISFIIDLYKNIDRIEIKAQFAIRISLIVFYLLVLYFMKVNDLF